MRRNARQPGRLRRASGWDMRRRGPPASRGGCMR